MITIKDYPGHNVIELVIDGGISEDEFQLVADKIDAVIAEHGQFRLIKVIQKMGMMKPAALWANLKFSTGHMKYLTHVAVVADHKWSEWLTTMGRPFMTAQVKTFELKELEAARTWIAQAPAASDNDSHE